MKKQLIIGMIGFIFLVAIVLAYTDGQILTQNNINNYNTTRPFSELYDDLECEILQNQNRTVTEDGQVTFVYELECWNVVIEEGDYVLRRKSLVHTEHLDRWKRELSRECGYPAEATCKEALQTEWQTKIQSKFKRRLFKFQEKIDSWKTQDEPPLALDL